MTTAESLSVFDRDTAVQPAGAGACAATITDRWNALGGGANGGYVLAVCLAALRAELPHPDPLTVTADFLRRTAIGPARLSVDVARQGRRLSTGEARLLQDGTETARVVATFADLGAADDRELVRNEPPDLAPPDELRDLMAGASLPGVTIADRISYRVAELPGWARGAPSGDPSAELWLRFADGRDFDTFSLPFLVDSMAPVVLELGIGASATVHLDVHVRARPAPGWVAARVTTRHVIGGFHEEDVELWDSTGRLVAQSRQMGVLT